MHRVKISFDFGTKEIRLFEDCTLQEIVDVVGGYEDDLTKVKIKTNPFLEDTPLITSYEYPKSGFKTSQSKH